MSIRKQKLEASLEGCSPGVKRVPLNQKRDAWSVREEFSKGSEKNIRQENAPISVSEEGSIIEASDTSSRDGLKKEKQQKIAQPPKAEKDNAVVSSRRCITGTKKFFAPLTVSDAKTAVPAAPAVVKTSIQPTEVSKQDLMLHDVEEIVQIVTFRVNNNYYGININAVQTIIKPESACPVPFTPDYVIGLINLRGQIVPVIDLRKRLNFPTIAETKDTRIVIITIGNEWAGVLVDAVTGVTNLTESEIEPPAAIVGDTDLQLLSGIGKSDSKLILILDVNALFAIGEKSKHKSLHPLLEATV
jgi:purine-binding chemotaxis protein CheW